MKKDFSIAETEWKVMEVLWREPMLTIGEIRSRLASTDWSDSTIKTLVRRLTQKGALGIDNSKGQFRYFPVANENECKLQETKSFLDRLYHGSLKMLMANLVSDSNLSKEEEKELMDIIDKMDEGKRK
ncbi:MAG: BlaI/MecI/CopY family transcriptional regulator [Clostridia bacterium]|nr:BlaI/MecI/CopY family transcriptional regulator [Clostridia bacterium]